MSKKNLVLLHGALGSAAQFDPWIPHLEPHFNLLVPDFEGHGKGEPCPGPFFIENFASFLMQDLYAYQMRGAGIFGYSMGGYVALQMEREFPGNAGKIFTFATKFDWTPEGAKKETGFLNPDLMLEKVPSFAKVLENRHPSGWRDVVNKTAEMMLGLGDNPLLTAEVLAGIQIPVKVGVGDQDNMVTEAETRKAAEAMPKGEFFRLENCPHPLEKIPVQAIVAEICEFFG